MKENMTYKTLSGSNNQYLVMGTRGDEEMAVSIQYLIAPNGLGLLLARFVVTSPHFDAQATNGGFQPFNKLQPRGAGQFKTQDGATVVGARFQRFPIPVFMPGPAPLQFLTMMGEKGIWDMVADWVMERAKGEGFTPMPMDEFKLLLPTLVGGNLGEYNDENYKFVLTFPEEDGTVQLEGDKEE